MPPTASLPSPSSHHHYDTTQSCGFQHLTLGGRHMIDREWCVIDFPTSCFKVLGQGLQPLRLDGTESELVGLLLAM